MARRAQGQRDRETDGCPRARKLQLYSLDCRTPGAAATESVHARTMNQYHKGAVKIANKQIPRSQHGVPGGLSDDDDCPSDEVSSADDEYYAAVA